MGGGGLLWPMAIHRIAGLQGRLVTSDGTTSHRNHFRAFGSRNPRSHSSSVTDGCLVPPHTAVWRSQKPWREGPITEEEWQDLWKVCVFGGRVGQSCSSVDLLG